MKYKQSVYKTFALISQLGISILVPILLCTFFGTWGCVKKREFFHASFFTAPFYPFGDSGCIGRSAQCMGTCETCE